MDFFKEYLCCPIDGGSLKFKNKLFECSLCGGKYAVTKESIIKFFTDFRPIKGLSDYESNWRDKSYRIANSDENKRGREGTFFERLYHNKRINDYKKIIDKYAASKHLTILDLGTSTGYCKPMFPEGSIRFGVDINMDTLKIQQTNILAKKSQKMNLIHADIYALPFKKKAFDMINMFVTFHRLKNSMLQKTGEYLKKNGILIISVPSKYGFLWGQKIRRFFWHIGLISNFKGIEDSFEFEVRRYSKKDIRGFSTRNLKCLGVYNSSFCMELVAVFKKID